MLRSVTQLFRPETGRKRLAQAPRRSRRPRTFEALETRRMFDASAIVSGTDLIIYGTAYNDVVEVTADQGQILVISSSNENPGTAYNHYSGVTNIKFFGLEGNDQFLNRTGLPIEVHGGKGRDYINVGNSSKAIVYGDEGNDVLIGNDLDNVLDGGEGNDVIYGFGGNDILFGGPGYDQIWGGRGRDIIFGGGGADMLYGEEDIDFLDGGLDSTPDTIYAQGDNANDVIVQELGQPTYGDRDPGDRVLKSNDDYEAQFRATGKLPASIGVTSSGYAIGGGISFKSSAQDQGVTAVNKKKINPALVDASFADWTGAGLSQYGELGLSVVPNSPAMTQADPDLEVGSVANSLNVATPVTGNYVEQTPVDRSEPLSSNEATPVDVSPTDPVIDAYSAQLALSALKPTTVTTAVKSSLSTSIKRF